MNVRTMISTRAWPAVARFFDKIVAGLIVAAGIILLVSLRLGWIGILPHARHAAEERHGEGAGPPTSVELTAEKLAAAGLHTTKVRRAPVQPTRDVPAEITYDQSRRVPVNAPVDGVILKVLAQPAQTVEQGQPLAVLSCAEVGVARDTVEKRKADVALARRDEERAATVASNVEALLALLAQRPKLADVEQALNEQVLGEYRERLVGAYSKLVLSEQILEASDTLQAGTLSTRLIEERRSNREQAAAQFMGACETARFAAVQDRDRARAAREQAERLLSVAEQSLVNLLGPWADMEPVTDARRLSELKLLAPAAGQVVERQAVENARVAAGSPLFVVADTSSLWISVEVHERDWRALQFCKPGEPLRVRIPALGPQPQQATVRWVGAQVDAAKRSVPLVAEIGNGEGLLKPGMFVWAMIPLDRPREGLVVPAGAIMRHENEPFVFVPAGERIFRRVDVRLGNETKEQAEIVSGLQEGDEVVEQGAFYLKSELLLDREE